VSDDFGDDPGETALSNRSDKVEVHVLTFTNMCHHDLCAYVRDLTTCEVCA
jgi:hypothetical protein